MGTTGTRALPGSREKQHPSLSCVPLPQLRRWLYAGKNLFPSVMFTRRNLSISAEALIEYFAVLHVGYVDQSPSRNAAAASSADLPAEQSDNSILNAVIVGLSNPLVAFVFKPEQPLVCNRAAEQLIPFFIGSH